MERAFYLAVFDGQPGERPLVYSRGHAYFPTGKNCGHTVRATTLAEAKRRAISHHAASRDCLGQVHAR